MFGGLPNTCAKVIILASGFSLQTFSTWSKSRFKVSNSISTNIGVNPTWNIGLIVVGNPAIGVITLVPLVVPIPIMLLGLFTSAIQALVFATLAGAYIGESVEDHH